MFTLPTRTHPAFTLLVQLLDEDKRDGLAWQPEQFAHTAYLVCRETHAGRVWLRAIIDTEPAWRDAYCDVRNSDLERWDMASAAL